MAYCGEMPRYNSNDWKTWRTNLDQSLYSYLTSNEPWKYDFYDRKEPGPGDCESSYLSRLVFKKFLETQGFRNAIFPQTVEPEQLEKLGGTSKSPKPDPSLWINGQRLGFYFDIMNNPKPYHCLGSAWRNCDSEPHFNSIYHTIGNFGLLPEWLRCKCDLSLNAVHGRLSERWDAFMQYVLIPRFKNFADGSMNFVRFVELSCAYQYVYGCPMPAENWRDSDFKWEKQVEEWRSWLRSQKDIRIASLLDCGNRALATDCDSEITRCGVVLEDVTSRNKMDDWIYDLIEARGRCIVAIARTHLQ